MEDTEVWRRYEQAKRYLILADVLLIAGGIVLYFFESAVGMHAWALVLGVVLIAAGVTVTLRFWRCPVCRHMLPLRNFGRLRHCPHCAVNLDE